MEPPPGSDRDRVPAYILAGGRSRRFGSDKARALVDGAPLITALARAIAPLVASVTVVAAREEAYADLGLRTIADDVPGRGPLGGLVRAFRDAEPGWLLLLACDWLGAREHWIGRLMKERRPDCDVVAFEGEWYEPLMALYHTRIESDARRQLSGDDASLQTLLAGVRTVGVPLPEDWSHATNLNEPMQKKRTAREKKGG